MNIEQLQVKLKALDTVMKSDAKKLLKLIQECDLHPEFISALLFVARNIALTQLKFSAIEKYLEEDSRIE